MEKKPNHQWKIPAKVEPIPEEIPVNHPENILFCLLGAWSALILSLSLYQQPIHERLNVNRSPASLSNPSQLVPTIDSFHPYENFPIIY